MWIICEATNYFGSSSCQPTDSAFDCMNIGGRVWVVLFQGRMGFGMSLGFVYSFIYLPAAIYYSGNKNEIISSFRNEDVNVLIKAMIEYQPKIGYVVECYHEAYEDYTTYENDMVLKKRRDSFSGTSRRLEVTFPYNRCEDHSLPPPTLNNRIVLMDVDKKMEFGNPELEKQFLLMKEQLMMEHKAQDNHIKVTPFLHIAGFHESSGFVDHKKIGGFRNARRPFYFNNLWRILSFLLTLGFFV